jgi:hypothetical protein
MNADFKKLVPEITKWNNGQGVNISSWIEMMGDYAHAVGYSVIFWPSFIEKDGCVFRANVTNIEQWSKAYNGDRQAIESTANHFHLCDLHCNDTEGNTPERLQYLASVLKEIYTCKLKLDFPQKSFRVDVYNEAEGPVVTFYQETEK